MIGRVYSLILLASVLPYSMHGNHSSSTTNALRTANSNSLTGLGYIDERDQGDLNRRLMTTASPGFEGLSSLIRIRPADYWYNITCAITLGYRPVDDGISSIFNHSYIVLSKEIESDDPDIGDTESYDLAEGLPQYNVPFAWGTLTGNVWYDFFPPDSRDTGDNPYDPLDPSPNADPSTGSTRGMYPSSVCSAALDIENFNYENLGYIDSFPYDPTSGSIYTNGKNSNWYAWYMLANETLYLGTPPNAPGFP